jgi:hypothetical protein
MMGASPLLLLLLLLLIGSEPGDCASIAVPPPRRTPVLGWNACETL